MKKKTYNKRTKEPEQMNFLKPRLILAGNHLINPLDISSISKVKCEPRQGEDEFDEFVSKVKTMYIVKMISNPNPPYPLWVEPKDISVLLSCFDILEG